MTQPRGPMPPCTYPDCGAGEGESCRGTFIFDGRPLVHLVRAAAWLGDCDPMGQPISAIVDGWVLNDGSLYVGVRCADGVTRSLTLSSDRGWGRPL